MLPQTPTWLRGLTARRPLPGLLLAVLVVTLVSGPGVAAAQSRRQVAVIDLRGDAASQRLTTALGRALETDAELAPLADPGLVAAFTGALDAEGHDAIVQAQAAAAAAEDALARFELPVATARAAAGQAALLDAAPAQATDDLFARLAILEGQARFLDHDIVGASVAFALAHALAPALELDPAVYRPEVLTTWNRVGHGTPTMVEVEIGGNGLVWIDGRLIGTAPVTQRLTAGRHVVQLLGPRRLTRGVLADVSTSGAGHIQVDDAPAPLTIQVARLRRELATAVDLTVAARVMRDLADLGQFGEAVLVTAAGRGELAVQVWRDHEPGFGAMRITGEADAIRLLEPLEPRPDLTALVLPPVPRPLPPPPPPWYRTTWAGGVLAGGLVAVISGVIYAVVNQPQRLGVLEETGFDPPNRARRR